MTDEELDIFIGKLKAALRRSLDRNYQEPTTKQLLAQTLHAIVENAKESKVLLETATILAKAVNRELTKK